MNDLQETLDRAYDRAFDYGTKNGRGQILIKLIQESSKSQSLDVRAFVDEFVKFNRIESDIL